MIKKICFILLFFLVITLSSMNVQAGISDNLTAYWSFDDGEGNIASDSIGENVGSINGATWTQGKFGNALLFDGVDDYVNVGTDNFGIYDSNQFTISLWMNPANEDVTYRSLILRGQYVFPFSLMTYGDRIRTIIRTDSRTNYLLSNHVINENEWNHIVMIYNQGERAIYINGNEEGSDSIESTLEFANNQPTYIGGASNPFNGIIDEVKIYNRALSPEEISELYEGEPSLNPICGNNIIEGAEVCDGSDLNLETCATQGYSSGELNCLSDCSGYDTSGCLTIKDCSDCDTLGLGCSLETCHDLGNCYYDPTWIPWESDCFNISIACSSITKCSDYTENECSYDSCNLNCEWNESECIENVQTQETYVADYNVAKESVLRSIPIQYLNYSRDNFVVAYQHSSHGTHVSRGVWGLEQYKTGDDTLFSIVSPGENWSSGMLDFRDYLMVTSTPPADSIASYAPNGEDVRDLTVSFYDGLYNGESYFVETTRNYLDDPANSDVNVIMWSWCNVVYSYVDIDKYLEDMQTLINEYGKGGTNPRASTNPVDFIFMTGHANADANTGSGQPEEKAQTILDYCEENGYFCLDYYGIDTHDMSDTYWDDAGDDGDSTAYGGNFYQDWEDSHTEGVDWFRSINEGGTYYPGAHNTQYITANRKAYAFWWIMARLAGWDGNYEN